MDEEYRKYRIRRAHAYLERIRLMGEDCAGLKEQVDDAYSRAAGVKGIDYTAIRVQTSPNDDAMVEALESIKCHVRDYAVKLAEYEGERYEASRALDRLDDPNEARVLRMRYLLDWEWDDVRSSLGYKTVGGVAKLKERALVSYSYVMPERDPIHPAM